MAERIGSAYVRVFFRSSGEDLDDQIKKDKGFEKAGERAAEKTGKGFNEEWVKQARERLKTDENYLKKSEAAYKGQMTRLKNDLDAFWTKERKNIENGIETPFKTLDKEWRNLEARFSRISDKLPDFHEVLDDTTDLDHRMQSLAGRFEEVAAWGRGIGQSYLDSSKDVESGTQRMVKSTDGLFSRIASGWTKARQEQKKTDEENGGFFKKWEKRSSSFGGFLSKMFGKGARNNFMNLVGTIVSGLTSIPTLGMKGFGAIGDTFGKDLTKPMEESASKAEGLGSSLAGLAAMAPEIGIALAVALAGLPLLLSAVASLLMLVTGAVIALAGALAFALIGAIGAVAGALVPLAAGFGVAMLAMTSMSKKSQHAFTGFTKAVREAIAPLAEAASKELFKNAAKDTDLLASGLKSLTPLVTAVAKALRQMGEGWMKALDSPEAKKFVTFLENTLPGMLLQIGQIVGNTAGALAGLFVAVTPLTEEFLGWLTGVTGALADMGKGGSKSKLSKFFRDLQPTMDSVGHAIEQVLGLIFDLFEGPGQKTGGDLFQSLADNVEKFRKFLAGAKKDGSLQQFFDQAKQFTDKIGEAIVAVGQLVAALDNPEMRSTLIFMVQAFTFVVRQVTFFAGLLAAQIHLWWVIGGAIKDAFNKVDEGVRFAVKKIRETFAPVKPFFQNLLKNLSFEGLAKAARFAWRHIKETFAPVGPWFRARWHTITTVVGNAWDSVSRGARFAWAHIKATFAPVGPWFAARWHSLVSGFQNAMSSLGRIASNAWNALKTGANNAVDAVVRFFHSIGGRISDLAGEFGRLAGQWGNAVVTAMRHVPGDIVDMFRGLAGQILSAIGSINIGSLIKGPQKLLSKVGLASGGLVFGPTQALIGERGAEAVVPLNRSLAQVDPAVRWLSAIAQGKAGLMGGGVGKHIDVGGITVVTPNSDSRAVAQQVVNRIAAVSYI